MSVVLADYNNEASLAAALQGQPFLIIFYLSMSRPAQTLVSSKRQLQQAAPILSPTASVLDPQNKGLSKDRVLSMGAKGACAEIEKMGVSDCVRHYCFVLLHVSNLHVHLTVDILYFTANT